MDLRSLLMPHRFGLLCGLFLIVAAAGMNYGSLHIGFLTDDFWLIDSALENPFPFNTGWADQTPYYHRPLTIVSLAIQHAIVGSDPVWYHAFNILSYAAGCSLVFWLLLLISGGSRTGGSKALLFSTAMVWSLVVCVHPANATNVSWISGRTDVLAMLFGVASLLACLTWVRTRMLVWEFISAAFAACAILSKEIGYVFPVACVMLLIQQRLFRHDGEIFVKDLRLWTLQSIQDARALVIVAFSLFVFRSWIFAFSEPTTSFEGNVFVQWTLLLGRMAYLMGGAIDTLSAYDLWTSGQFMRLAVAVFPLFVFGGLLVAGAIHGDQKTRIGLTLILCTTVSVFAPFFYAGWIAQRVMLVPITLIAIAAWPVLWYSVSALRRSKPVTIGGISVAGLLMCVIYVFAYHDSVRNSQAVAEIERDAIDQIITLADDTSRTVVILTYPHRLKQSYVMLALPYRLHFARQGSFGRADNIVTGLGIISSDRSSLESGVSISTGNKPMSEWVAKAGDPFQSFSLLDLEPDAGAAARDRDWMSVGETVQGKWFSVEALGTNELGRLNHARIRLNDDRMVRIPYVFSYSSIGMVRLQ